MEYYSAIKRNTFESVLKRQMNLEPIIQSEVSQKEKKQISYNNAYVWNLVEKAMAPHSSTLAWKIPWTEEPGRLQYKGVAEGQTRLKQLSMQECMYLKATLSIRPIVSKVCSLVLCL